MSNGVVVYTVYCRPRDYPNEYVVRRMVSCEGVVKIDANLWARGLTIDEVRAMIPYGLTRMDRNPNDDPVIAEVWL